MDIQGLVPSFAGVIYTQHERVDELNTRINDRIFPSVGLQPNLDFRPVPTKYTRFPIIADQSSRVPLGSFSYSISQDFAPPMSRGPVDNYIANVDKESALRNQFFALQRGCDRREYVPSSMSDLYRVTVESPYVAQPHPELFRQQQYVTLAQPPPMTGRDLFHNNTRTQLNKIL